MKKLNIEYADGTWVKGIELKKSNSREPLYGRANQHDTGDIVYATWAGYYILKPDGTAYLDNGFSITKQNIKWEIV